MLLIDHGRHISERWLQLTDLWISFFEAGT